MSCPANQLQSEGRGGMEKEMKELYSRKRWNEEENLGSGIGKEGSGSIGYMGIKERKGRIEEQPKTGDMKQG